MNLTTMPTSQPLFTVEQVELLRRLRNSGMMKEQIIQGYESLDRLDMEFGLTYTIPISLQNQLPQNGGAVECNGSLASNGTNHLADTDSVSLPTSIASSLGLQPSHSSSSQTNGNVTHTSLMQSAAFGGAFCQQSTGSYQPATAVRKRSFDLAFDGGDAASNFNFDEDSEEFKTELQNFVNNGDAQNYEEIKEFVIQNSIKQHQVGTFCGLSQSYVSRYLRGEYQDISDRSKRAIYRWYLIVKKNPAALAMTTNSPFSASKLKMMQQAVTISNGQDADFNSARRERFVFRPVHLERHFKEDNYPSYERREDIAKECNQAFEVPGRALCEREKVNVHTVTNWFANRRKELKKIAREEGLDNIVSQMRGRGRPCLSSLTVKVEPRDPERNGEHSPTNDEQRVLDTDEQLSLAVEVAAVNQAILALSGQADAENGSAKIKEEMNSS